MHSHALFVNTTQEEKGTPHSTHKLPTKIAKKPMLVSLSFAADNE